MELPSWQEKLLDHSNKDLPIKIPFNDARKIFAVDASGSTAGSIMRAQEKTVRRLHGNSADNVLLWATSCHDPQLIDEVAPSYFRGDGGTDPAAIMRNLRAVEQIQDSDLWVLLTDGNIPERHVHTLSDTAETAEVLQVPIILVITGSRYGVPGQSNISVGVTFFAAAREALILFKDYSSGQLFVIDAKGAFQSLKQETSDHISGWSSLSQFANEAEFNSRCKELGISFHPSDTRSKTRAVSLGTHWDSITDKALVNVPILLEQTQIRHSDLRNILEEEAVTQLALLCKTRGKLGLLRDLILRHKQEELLIRLEDRHGAKEIMERLQSGTVMENQLDQLREQLRQAHTANRETYAKLRDDPSEEQRQASELNKLINRALQIISGFEKSSYTADILNRKSNRAMRASVVSAVASVIHVAALDLSTDINAFRGSCSICCEDNQIMSIVLKQLDTVEENTTDFALNFPLAAAQAKQNQDMISAQCICFQCALAISRSIYQEDIVAILPTVDYEGPNKKYVDHQLTLAITAGLATGASGIAQLFLTILDRTLETKDWCSREHVDDPEVQSRRQVFEWMLSNLLERCRCRENFAETGTWVAYPKALLWAFKNYESAGLDGWIIQYPLAGFCQILRWAEILRLPIEAEKIEAVKTAKLIHQTVAVIMKGLLHQKDRDQSWTYPFLHLIYKASNAPGVPRDMGTDSLLLGKNYWGKLGEALGQWPDVTRFLRLFDTKAREAVVSRLQLIIFWALYTQKGHTTPKTFFTNIASREPLGLAVLDPTAPLPQDEVKAVLMSIFCDTARLKKDAHLGRVMPRFATPFGASVLRCDFPSCNVVFYNPDDLVNGVEAAANGIRARRAEHFAEVFGIPGAFQSQTGLPDPTSAPKAPTSYHNTLHISTARAWSRLPFDKKIAIIISGPSYPGGRTGHNITASFVADVRHEICKHSHRGNIYSATIDEEVRNLLPSFLDALKVASKKMGLEDCTGAAYVHDFTKNTIVGKMEYELGL
ncbi:MAG: hypothetical protein LQ350_007677 [Teloschistes chrysophthalmus]|nr:MAG: hypothetical protein LQ350_007677 [Niorma chrysophthalma]